MKNKMKFYCITLEKYPQRWQESCREFIKAKIHVTPSKGYYLEDRPALGCAFSHKNIIKLAKENDLDMVCVFEDDIKFYQPEKFLNKLEQAISKLPSDWHILYLGGLIARNGEIRKTVGRNLKVSGLMCTYGLVYNKRSYDNIIVNVGSDVIGNKYATYDNWLAFEYQLRQPCYIVNNILVKERGEYSTIEKKWKNTGKKYLVRFLIYKYGLKKMGIILGYLGDIFGFSDKKKWENNNKIG